MSGNNNNIQRAHGDHTNTPSIVNFEHDAASGIDYAVYSDGTRIPHNIPANQDVRTLGESLPSFREGFNTHSAAFTPQHSRSSFLSGTDSQHSGRPPIHEGFDNDFRRLPPPPGLETRGFMPPGIGYHTPGSAFMNAQSAYSGSSGLSSTQNPQSASVSARSLGPEVELPPLPPSEDEDFPPPEDIHKIARPLRKVAGARRSSPPPSKGKGKAKAEPVPASATSSVPRKRPASSSGPPAPKRRGGRVRGAGNYTTEDKIALEEAILEVLPLGRNEWSNVEQIYNERAREEGRAEREWNSLKKKHEALLRIEKPTGKSECPAEIELAHQAEYEICSKAGSRELADSEESEDEAISISSSDETQKHPRISETAANKENARTSRAAPSGVVRRVPTIRPRANNQGLLTNLTNRLDPSVQAARDEARSATTLQMTQMFGMSSQIRDLQGQISSLHEQLRDAERRCNDALRRADIAELHSTFAQTSARRHGLRTPSRPRHTDSRATADRSASASAPSDTYRQDVFYPGGGRYVGWFHAEDSEEMRESGWGPDGPGIRRYITSEEDIMNAAFRPPPRDSPSPSARLPGPSSAPLSFRPASPAFRSAASNLNNMLPDAPTSPTPPLSSSGETPSGGKRTKDSEPCTALILSPSRRRHGKEKEGE